MANVFDEMGFYWAEIADKDQTEEQIKFLTCHLKPEGFILDLACGTGRHSIPLSQQGYAMVGLDVSPNLLKIAKHRFRQIQVIRADMRFLPFKAQAFAAAVSMDTSFGYLSSKKDDAQSLIEIRRVVREGSVLVIDVFNSKNLVIKSQEKTSSSKEKEYPSFFLQQKRTLSPSGRRLCDLWTIRDKSGGESRRFVHSVRLYTQSELKSLLKKAGFAVNAVYGGYDDESFGSGTSRLILVGLAI